MTPSESVAGAAETGLSNGPLAPGCALDRDLANELWRNCDAAEWGLTRDEFDQILLEAGAAQNFGREIAEVSIPATRKQQVEFFRELCA